MQTALLTKSLQENIDDLSLCLSQLQKKEEISEKLQILNRHLAVQSFLKIPSALRSLLETLPEEEEYLLKQLIVIEQMDRLIPQQEAFSKEELKEIDRLLQWLSDIEYFYRELGGILGYHVRVLRLLAQENNEVCEESCKYYPPPYIDISKRSKEVDQSLASGFENLPFMAELYPLGGAADRLHLIDEKTGKELPAAKLTLGSSTLLEILIRDLQAREYLYYKFKGLQLQTPIAIMTSLEKNNHDHVLSICEEKKWFYRPKERFRFFTQPLVPTLLEDGNWCVSAYYKPLRKPGGHGILWKLANDEGILDWLLKQGCKKALIRQINNPIAGIDYGLLAFMGCGFQRNALFGFASCSRLPGVAEGINVLKEEEKNAEYRYSLSNIEYCDFKQHKNSKELETSKKFPANTNVLFADLQGLKKAVKVSPFPGTLINLKTVQLTNAAKKCYTTKVARLESTMQNIADVFEEEYKEPLQSKKMRKTFITLNERHKTISTAKKVYRKKGTTLETPERCFYDRLRIAHELLSQHCNFAMPAMGTVEEYFAQGPNFLVEYHPALGPLYSIIAQKIHGGEMAPRSSLFLEIAELDMENLNLQGAMEIRADRVMGHLDTKKHMVYSENSGKCTLKNVRVHNLGAKWKDHQNFWKGRILCREKLEIILHGSAEFYAEDVVLEGNLRFEVPHNYFLEISSSKENGYIMKERHLKNPSWYYQYEFTEDFQILLKKKKIL